VDYVCYLTDPVFYSCPSIVVSFQVIDVGEETDQSERFISMPGMIEDTLMRCCPLKAQSEG